VDLPDRLLSLRNVVLPADQGLEQFGAGPVVEIVQSRVELL